MAFIYKLVNKINGKIYVGSTIEYERRIWYHSHCLNKNVHPNDYLQKQWNKYGEDNFEFQLIEECNEDIMIQREQFWIDYHDSMNRIKGYNLKGAGQGKLSDEAKMKISKSKKGIRTSLGFTGKHHSEETKKKISKANKGKKCSDELKKNNSIKRKEYFKNNPEAKDIIIESNRKRIVSAETRKKMSESQKRRFSKCVFE